MVENRTVFKGSVVAIGLSGVLCLSLFLFQTSPDSEVIGETSVLFTLDLIGKPRNWVV